MDGHNDLVVPPPPAMHVVVVAGGEAPSDIDIEEHDLVIAADSGADAALELGLVPDIVVGDLDSISAATLERLAASGTTIARHDVDKNESDLDLALELAVERGATSISVVGADRGRLSHLLVNAGVLAAPRRSTVPIRWRATEADVHVVHGGSVVEVTGSPGDLISLVAMHGDAAGVTTTGLRWGLAGATIGAGSSLGLSNEFVEPIATISLEAGVVLAVHERPQG